MSDLALLVKDQPDLAELLNDYLEAEDFRIHIIADGFAVGPWVKKYHPSVVLLDFMSRNKGILQNCREICRFSGVPIIMTTAKVEKIDGLIDLELGADDYHCKPYSHREAVARVKALLRRHPNLFALMTPRSVWLRMVLIVISP